MGGRFLLSRGCALEEASIVSCVCGEERAGKCEMRGVLGGGRPMANSAAKSDIAVRFGERVTIMLADEFSRSKVNNA